MTKESMLHANKIIQKDDNSGFLLLLVETFYFEHI